MGDGLVEGEPVKFADKLADAFLAELAFTVDAFFDFDDEGEVVFVALGHIAHQQVV